MATKTNVLEHVNAFVVEVEHWRQVKKCSKKVLTLDTVFGGQAADMIHHCFLRFSRTMRSDRLFSRIANDDRKTRRETTMTSPSNFTATAGQTISIVYVFRYPSNSPDLPLETTIFMRNTKAKVSSKTLRIPVPYRVSGD